MAGAISAALDPVLGGLDPVNTGGRMTQVLRETRMAAVVVEPLAEHDAEATARIVRGTEALGLAIARGVQRGIEDPDLDATAEQPIVRLPPD